jgi:ADP-dependent NAD(P)H-hydrate dehydratase / NAD(P)H-hydrate epimerase
MTELLTAAQMRAIEQAAITSGHVTGLELMERAGRGVVEAVLAEWPELGAGSHRAVVLCGPGNNGGDGFVVARCLRERGWQVEVFLYGDPGKLPPDARANFERWGGLGKVSALSTPSPSAAEIGQVDRATRVTGNDPGPSLVIDALFGTGLQRPIAGLSGLLSEIQVNDIADDGRPPYIVAIDLPSGLCSDSGRILGGPEGVAIGAHLTVAFHALKRGHVLEDGPLRCGTVRVVDIGLDSMCRDSRQAIARLHDLGAEPWRLGRVIVDVTGREGLHPDLAKRSGHKFSHGHALILAGGPGKGGAARLAARGALRIGAGLVTLACPSGALQENAAQLNAIMLKPLKEVTDLIEFLADGRINAVCLGPGLGRGERAQQLVTAVLAAERATVLDADALTVHEDDPQSLFYQLHEACVLTPHAGEFRRLFPDIAELLDAPATTGPAFSRVDATREAAARAGCTVLFKGPDTVIADASGRCAVNASAYDRAAPWLATAGSGDVLAGFITGLLARGLGPLAAAETAAWLHTECARAFGPGLIAEDLPEALPGVFRALGL